MPSASDARRLFEILGAIKADDEVRAVVLKGAGDKALRRRRFEGVRLAPSAVKAGTAAVRDLCAVPGSQPLIAALHGYTGFGPWSCAAIPDCVAGCGLRFRKWSRHPAGAGGTQTLPRALGYRSAGHADGAPLTHRKYLRGMVSRIAAREELLQAAEDGAKIASFVPLL
jgi:enoyl-CoA hydratase/carnithine racemase